MGLSPQELIEHGHFKRARDVLEISLKANSSDPETLWLLARAKLALGSPIEALRLAEEAVKAKPGNANYRETLAEVHGALALRAGFLHRFSEARAFRRDAEAAVALDPQNPSALEALAEFRDEAPGILGGDHESFLALTDRLIQVAPVQGYLFRADRERKRHHTQQAEADLRRALEIDPRSYAARVRLARLELANGRSEAAVEEARKALEVAPDRVRAYAIIAQIYAGDGRTEELRLLLESASKDCPDDREPFYVAGKTLFLSGRDLSEAEGDLRFYLGLEPEGEGPSAAEAHMRLGQILAKEGRPGEAVTEFKTALSLDPDLEAAKAELSSLKGFSEDGNELASRW